MKKIQQDPFSIICQASREPREVVAGWKLANVILIYQKGVRKKLTNLISFYDKVTHIVDEVKVMDAVFLDFSALHEELAGWQGSRDCSDGATSGWW